jgi:PPOX class probable F420-dependent enzyme
VRLDDDACWERLRRARHGVLSTVHPARGVDAVPVVFVAEGRQLLLPIDTVKAKSGARLQRLRNIDADARATLLVDHYDDDWAQLWWVRAQGLAHHAPPTSHQLDQLAARFPAYATRGSVTSVVVLAVDEVAGWTAERPEP